MRNATQASFQFEGGALQGLCKQMHVANFEDMSALTSLARPGPLSSGGAQEYIRRQTGESEVSFLPMTEDILGVTKGIFIYQEQGDACRQRDWKAVMG